MSEELTERQAECAHAASTASRGTRTCDRCGLELTFYNGPDGEGHVDASIKRRQ